MRVREFQKAVTRRLATEAYERLRGGTLWWKRYGS